MKNRALHHIIFVLPGAASAPPVQALAAHTYSSYLTATPGGVPVRAGS